MPGSTTSYRCTRRPEQLAVQFSWQPVSGMNADGRMRRIPRRLRTCRLAPPADRGALAFASGLLDPAGPGVGCTQRPTRFRPASGSSRLPPAGGTAGDVVDTSVLLRPTPQANPTANPRPARRPTPVRRRASQIASKTSIRPNLTTQGSTRRPTRTETGACGRR